MGTNTRQYKKFSYSRFQRPGQFVDIQLEGPAHPTIAKFFELFLLRELLKGGGISAQSYLSSRSPVFTGSMRDSVDIRPLSKVKGGVRGARASFKAPYAVYNESRVILNSWVASPAVQVAAYSAVILAHAEAKRRAEKAALLNLSNSPAVFLSKPSRVRRRTTSNRGTLIPMMLRFVGVGGRLIRTVTTN